MLALVAAVVPGASGAATDEQRLVPAGSGPGLRLVEAGGERHVVRRAPRVRALPGRSSRRRSLVYLAHLSDFQLADEASPARFEYLSGVKPAFHGFWRPQEAFGPHVIDQAVRAVNAHRTSPVAGAGGRARMDLALVTGDMADTAQVNELRWAVRLLNGGRIDPYSGRRVSPANPCRVGRAQRRRLNRMVSRRAYAGTPRSRRALRRWPGALARAQRPFTAQGLQVPWYSSRGNHDALPQGHFGPLAAQPRSASIGCRKVVSAAGPGWLRGEPWTLLRATRASGRLVPPDPRRRFLSSPLEFRRLHGRADRAHGLGFTSPVERRRSRGTALYYAWSPSRELRFISLDTVADAGGASGNIDHPQYRWLARELRRAERRRQLVVVYGHHPLEMMVNRIPDERAGRFDRDPRSSSPVHLGPGGRGSLRSLLMRHRNVVLYLAGHKHYDRAWRNFRRDGTGFWQVVTASLAGAPQQVRLLELMDNRDGTLSLFTTMLDHAAPVTVPARRGSALGPADLASISRTVAWGRRPLRDGRRRRPSGRAMRNVELVISDPRRRAGR